MSKAKELARIRNWNKRMVAAWTSGFQHMLKKQSAGLTDKEKMQITQMILLGQTLLSDWKKRVTDK